MPLVLGLRLGEDVFIDDTGFKLVEITSGSKIKVQNELTGVTYVVTVGRATEVLPNVFLSMGDRSTTLMARLSISAPRTVKVLTGAKYRTLRREEVLPPPGGAPQRSYTFPPDIISRARELGIYGNTAESRLREMAKLSVPVTMPGFNHRFEQYVMFIDRAGAVVALDVLSDEERRYYDERDYDRRRDGDQRAPGEAEVEWKSGHRTDGKGLPRRGG